MTARSVEKAKIALEANAEEYYRFVYRPTDERPPCVRRYSLRRADRERRHSARAICSGLMFTPAYHEASSPKHGVRGDGPG
jgi:hypothetical protein